MLMIETEGSLLIGCLLFIKMGKSNHLDLAQK